MKREPANSTVFSSKPIELLYVTVTKRHTLGERECVPKECNMREIHLIFDLIFDLILFNFI